MNNPDYPGMLAALEKTLKLWQSGDYKRDDYHCPLCKLTAHRGCACCACVVLLGVGCLDMHRDSLARYAPRMAIRYLNKMIAMVKEKIG